MGASISTHTNQRFCWISAENILKADVDAIVKALPHARELLIYCGEEELEKGSFVQAWDKVHGPLTTKGMKVIAMAHMISGDDIGSFLEICVKKRIAHVEFDGYSDPAWKDLEKLGEAGHVKSLELRGQFGIRYVNPLLMSFPSLVDFRCEMCHELEPHTLALVLKGMPNLKTLHLSHLTGDLTLDDDRKGMKMVEAILKAQCKAKLEYVAFGSSIEPKAIQCLVAGLVMTGNLQHLDLGANNSVPARELHTIIDTIPLAQKRALKTLVLPFSASGYSEYFAADLKDFTSLEYFGCEQIEDIGDEQIKPLVSRNAHTLKAIVLDSTGASGDLLKHIVTTCEVVEYVGMASTELQDDELTAALKVAKKSLMAINSSRCEDIDDRCFVDEVRVSGEVCARPI